MKDFEKFKIMYFIKEKHGYRFVDSRDKLKSYETASIFNAIKNQSIKIAYNKYPHEVKDLIDMLVSL